MNETEWNSATDPITMLKCLCGLGKVSERKLRLFAVACCRSLWVEQFDDLLSQAIETVEQYAERLTSKAALKRIRQGLRARRHALPTQQRQEMAKWWAFWLAEVSAAENAYRGVADELQRMVHLRVPGLRTNAPSEMCALLGDIFGNPFRFLTVNPTWLSWNGASVVRLAKDIDSVRAFDRLPILADALEEAGCADADILNHCRQPGEHVRGCWVVDLVLGKS